VAGAGERRKLLARSADGSGPDPRGPRRAITISRAADEERGYVRVSGGRADQPNRERRNLLRIPDKRASRLSSGEDRLGDPRGISKK